MCVHLPDDFDVALTRAKLTRGMLDDWLKQQTEDADYRNSYSFFLKFGLHLGLDHDISVDVLRAANRNFVQTIGRFVADPNAHLFGAARERLLHPKSREAGRALDLIQA